MTYVVPLRPVIFYEKVRIQIRSKIAKQKQHMRARKCICEIVQVYFGTPCPLGVKG